VILNGLADQPGNFQFPIPHSECGAKRQRPLRIRILDVGRCCGCRDGDEHLDGAQAFWALRWRRLIRRYGFVNALCYEIAATLSGDTATSMRRLGDSYTGLAEASDKPRTGIFVPTKRHERPHCVNAERR
jgi:hypothetical protein